MHPTEEGIYMSCCKLIEINADVNSKVIINAANIQDITKNHDGTYRVRLNTGFYNISESEFRELVRKAGGLF